MVQATKQAVAKIAKDVNAGSDREVSDTHGATHPSGCHADVCLPLKMLMWTEKGNKPKSSVAQTEPGTGAYM